MDAKITKSKVITSLFWKFMERGGTSGVQFIIQLILARLLLPEDYGLIVIVAIFITIAKILIQNGFNTALIQKKDANETDYSSVFYLSLGLALIIYLLIFFLSPIIANFYGNDIITGYLRIYSISLFFGAFNSIQNAIISQNMEFKKLFFGNFGAIILSGTIGIITAYNGYGGWALVFQQLSNQIAITIILWFVVKWRPKLLFSWQRVKELFSFGWKILISSLLTSVVGNLRSLIIGKVYQADTLGYFNKGKEFPKIIISNINGTIQAVMFPALASMQDDKKKVRKMMQRSIVSSAFILFPILVLLSVSAESIVLILLTEKWLPSVIFLQIFCVSYALWPIHTANLQAIKAIGRSDIFLKLEIVKKLIGIVILISSIQFGVVAMAYGSIAGGIISSFINAYPNSKLLDYKYTEQLTDVLPPLLLSLLIGIITFTFKWLGLSSWLTLILQLCCGSILYIILAWVFKLESFTYLLDLSKNFITQTFFSSEKNKEITHD